LDFGFGNWMFRIWKAARRDQLRKFSRVNADISRAGCFGEAFFILRVLPHFLSSQSC
jgi:hypothetical protein